MEAMGKELIQLCDQLEQHGLVDYQMGIWEEEILSGRWIIFLFFIVLFCVCACHALLYLLTQPMQLCTYANLFLVLGQCLDLMESRPELLRIQTIPEPATATQRP